MSKATRYNLARTYGKRSGELPTNEEILAATPSWLCAVISAGLRPTYSRALVGSRGGYADDFERKSGPVILDVQDYNVPDDSKANHVKTLMLRVAPTIDCLDPEIMLPGDWILFWLCPSDEARKELQDRVERLKPCNRFHDGLRFLGRIGAPRKQLVQAPEGMLTTSFSVQAIGFAELDNQFYYDFALATQAGVRNDMSEFMAQLGLDWTKWAAQEQLAAGEIKDNVDVLVPSLIDTVLGQGVAKTANLPIEQAKAAAISDPVSNHGKALAIDDLLLAPQADRQAPYAYLVPRDVGLLLGRSQSDASKEAGLFGYADVLDTIIGVQQFGVETDPAKTTFYPSNVDDTRGNESRHFTQEKVKGTYLPQDPTFCNRPLWQILASYTNHAINEIYTVMKPDIFGNILPTLVLRQIPFSSESIEEDDGFHLTRFMSLPRWVAPASMVLDMDIGRGDATRTNLLHVYGDAVAFSNNVGLTEQMTLNPPIFDKVDIARHGMRPYMDTVQCSLVDQVREDGARTWMKAIADWKFGSHLTLNGSVTLTGTHLPVCPGDNFEFDDIVYHIEAVSHTGSISEDGIKTARTRLRLTNGMPVDQSEADEDFPVYAGFEHPHAGHSHDPGLSNIEE